MALAEHLRELRNRVVVAAAALLLGTIAGWSLYDPVNALLFAPLQRLGGEPNYPSLTDPLAVHLQVALFIGVIVSSPVWLYQIWAFVVPGLTKREKRTAAFFLLTAVPLFLTGCYLAYLTLPKAVEILVSFTPPGARNILPASDYFGFTTRFILAFGCAFLLPVFLVGLNLAHVLPGRVMLRGWRVATIALFVFAAVMTPTPDPWTMLALAVPMIALYFGACGVALLVDRRRDRSRPSWADLDDETASPLPEADPAPPAPTIPPQAAELREPSAAPSPASAPETPERSG